MIDVHFLDNQRILIWGYGREGKSTEAFLKKHVPTASVFVYEGARDGFSADEYDVVFKSPGIPYFVEEPKFTSQTELFLSLFGRQTIGITGTKGKSTTSTMMAHVLSEISGRPTFLVGNIGLPCLDYVDEITPDAIVVFELSCHQLAMLHVSPHIAVFLNLFEEHLDYYKTMERYGAVKSHITAFQSAEDYFYCGGNVPAISTRAATTVIREADPEAFSLSVPGWQNQFNATFVLRIATELFHLPAPAVREALSTFRGLPHRLMPVGTYSGVDYYDDSISTIPEATIRALEAIHHARTVLVGGMDRGISYDLLIQHICDHPEYRYILMYDSGKRIYREVAALPNVFPVTDLREAVEKAKAITKPGEAVILSPAAASYGYFKNFEERGDRFIEFVREADAKSTVNGENTI